MLGFILGLIVVGLIAGFLARALVAGPRPHGHRRHHRPRHHRLEYVGGFLADVLFQNDAEDRGLSPAGIIGSIIGAVIVLLISRAVTSRRGALR